MTSRRAVQNADLPWSPPVDALSVGDGPGFLPRLLPELEALTQEIARHRGPHGWLGDRLIGRAELESPAMAVALCTLEGRFIEVNDALVSLGGYTRNEIVGRTGNEIGLWTDTEDMLRCIRQRGAVDNYTLAYRTRDGRTRRMLLAARIITVNGRGCVLAVGADVAELSGFDYEATL